MTQQFEGGNVHRTRRSAAIAALCHRLPEIIPEGIRVKLQIMLGATGVIRLAGKPPRISPRFTCNPPPVTFGFLIRATEPPSGSLFSIGTTLVNCTASDPSRNTNRCSFTLTVRDTVPPALTCPTNRVVECTWPGGNQVYFDATATDVCDTNVSVNCMPPSGSLFPMGTTVVNCTCPGRQRQ
jgi:hypothetical protein